MKKEISSLIVALAVSGLAVLPWELWFGDGMGLDPRLRPFALVFGAAWTVRRAFVLKRAWSRWRSWRLPAAWSVAAEDLPIESTRRWVVRPLAKDFYSCLPRRVARWIYPDRGILLGRAFRWSPEHTQQLESHLQKGKPLPVGRDVRGGYPALHAVGRKEEQPLVLPWSELVGHVLIGGTTRSGKTRLLEVILSEAIRGPGTVIIIDPKGDAELLIRAASEAHRADRPFAFFGPAFPQASASFNPLGMCQSTTELAARVQALMPGGGGMSKGDPFFTEYPLAVIEKIGAAQAAVGDRWTIAGLNAASTLVPPFEDLVARYLYQKVLGNKNQDVPALDELKEEYAAKRAARQDHLADALLDDQEKPREHFVQVTANLVPAFRGVTGGKMDRLLSSSKPQLTWDGVVGERKIVYFAMSSLMYGEVANRIGRVILQDLIGFLGRRYAREDPAAMTPLTVLIDEFSNVAYPGFIDALNKGGGARANIMLAMQSLADPEAAMGKDGTQRVLDNLNTRVWFRLTDDATAKLAVEGLGMTSVSREDISHSLSFGGSAGTSAGSRGAMQYVDRSLVRPEWVTGLPRGEAFVRSRGENWKLRVPLLRPVSKDEVREVAERYGLEKVLTEIREQTGQTDEEGLQEATDGADKRSARQSAGKSGAGRKATRVAAGDVLNELAHSLNDSQEGSEDDAGEAGGAEMPQVSAAGEPASDTVEEPSGETGEARAGSTGGESVPGASGRTEPIAADASGEAGRPEAASAEPVPGDEAAEPGRNEATGGSAAELSDALADGEGEKP